MDEVIKPRGARPALTNSPMDRYSALPVTETAKGRAMAKFTIQPHGRPQEWIAHEKGYFRDEGLDYEFRYGPSALSQKELDAAGK
jgi:ABC-type nitrate/sulfonate/bicarbonate transport system substrate-binding protein